MNTLATFRRSTLRLSLAAAVAGISAGSAWAGVGAMQEELNLLHERINVLEASQPESIATNGEDGSWSDSVSVGGYVAVDTYYADYGDTNESDIIISDAEMWVEAEIAENVSAMVLFYYEDGYDSPDVDEATITFSAGGGMPLSFTAGRTYLPFGTYETNMISDPLSLEIGEIREDILMVNFEADGFYGGAYIFNGDIEEDGSDNLIENYGLNMGYLWEQDKASLDIGLDWINSIEDTDGIEWVLNDYGISSVTERTQGIAVHANGQFGPISVFTEYVGALDDLAGNNTNTKIKAWNLEAGYNFVLGGMDSTVALAYQETSEALEFDLPEERIVGAVSMEVMDSTTLAFEYKKDKDYYGENTHTGTAQVAVEF